MMVQVEDGWIEVGKVKEPRLYQGSGGELFPSVTTVCGIIENQHITKWRGRLGNNMADEVMSEAGEFGDAVHDLTAIADTVDAIPFTLPADLDALITRYITRRRALVQEVIAIEKVVMSYKYGYAGRLDRVFILKGESADSVWDIKTGSARKIHRAQTMAYKMAWEEQTGRKVGRRGVVEVSRKRRTVRFVDHDEDDTAGWLTLLATYKWLNSIGEV